MRLKKLLIILILFFLGFITYVYLSNQQADNNDKESLPLAVEKINYAQSTDSAGDPFLGDKDAKLVLVEFADFECPYCRQEFSIIREVANLYPQIKIIFRDLPLISIHENALSAAIAANCAHQQGKFWQYHDQLFLNQEQLGDELYNKVAVRSGLNVEIFNQCQKDNAVKEEIIRDVEDAKKMNVEGTPTFFLNGKKISGVISLDVWQKIINTALLGN